MSTLFKKETVNKDYLKNTFLQELNILQHKKLNKKICVVFVFNSLQSQTVDFLHLSECLYDNEIALIEDALHIFPNLYVIKIDGEEQFIAQASRLRKQFDNVFVYSMAQNVSGVGRRCLIPLLCDYYGFSNISSNARSCFLGGDKELMHSQLDAEIPTPNRLYLNSIENDVIVDYIHSIPKFLIKPNSESASIGVSLIDSAKMEECDIINCIKQTLQQYDRIFLDEFIDGDEVECAVFPWHEKIFVADPVKIIKQCEYLDYQTVKSDNYGFEFFQNSAMSKVQYLALAAYNSLQFDSIARFDFKVHNETPYLFDITPNPTVSKCSSTSRATLYIENDARTIYRILFLERIIHTIAL